MEMVARSDSVKTDNMSLQQKSDSVDKCILRLKRHKNKLTQRVLKLQHENHKNKEKVRELNAQVTLMQLKRHSQAPFSQIPATGVNIQAFNTPVKSQYFGDTHFCTYV